jgi:hypothetical protein
MMKFVCQDLRAGFAGRRAVMTVGGGPDQVELWAGAGEALHGQSFVLANSAAVAKLVEESHLEVEVLESAAASLQMERSKFAKQRDESHHLRMELEMVTNLVD